MVEPGASNDAHFTVLAVGCIAALISATGHEAVGHGLTCLAVGGRITLLTTTHFQCDGGSALVDAAGPAMNLVLAGLGALGLGLFRRSAPALRLFFLALCAFNIFWFAGEALRSSLTTIDDEAALARDLDWPAWWRGACLVSALAIYAAGVWRLVDPVRRFALGPTDTDGATRARMLLAGGAVALAVAGACWARDRTGGGWEGLLSVGAASAPLLISARVAVRRGPLGEPAAVRASAVWMGLAIAGLVLFCLTQGRGVGPQA